MNKDTRKKKTMITSGVVYLNSHGDVEAIDWVWVITTILVMVIAVSLAASCNPQSPILAGVFAFFFPELYLLWYVFTHLILGETCAPMVPKAKLITP